VSSLFAWWAMTADTRQPAATANRTFAADAVDPLTRRFAKFAAPV
tara:strand:+ start:489 stop:623 length:135 start_codon:yes stop_codon:yes gene_type:complete